MKIIIASSERNRIEEKVAAYSLLKCGHTEDEINIIDGQTGLIYDVFRKHEPRHTDISNLGSSTSFTMARLYMPMYFEDDEIVIVDSDIIAYHHMSSIFEDNQGPGIYVRKAYHPNEWATSVLGWKINDEIRQKFSHYRKDVESEKYSLRDKIYLRKNFVNAIGFEVHRIDKEWNNFDIINNRTKLVHFTNLATQPWRSERHPFEDDWFEMAREAKASGLLTDEDIKLQSKFSDVLISGKPLLRLDFCQLLNGNPKPKSVMKKLSSHLLLFYRNLKFHSPMKYIYSALVS